MVASSVRGHFPSKKRVVEARNFLAAWYPSAQKHSENEATVVTKNPILILAGVHCTANFLRLRLEMSCDFMDVGYTYQGHKQCCLIHLEST
jgi:hypothetical protein